MSYSERLGFVKQVAQMLGETEPDPITQIEKIVNRFGQEQVGVWLHQTQEIEQAGGELLPNRSRRRTTGGVFFRVVRDAITEDDRKTLFPRYGKKKTFKRGPHREPTPSLPVATWDDRVEVVKEAQQQPGKATTVKITVIGKIGKAVERQGFTLVTLNHAGDLGSLPKGIPVPATPLPTAYILYIGSKQWNKVKESIRNPDDVLIVEGVPVLDPKYQAITVFATNTTTKLIQAATRAAQKTSASN